jgi:hypothetical protein
VGTKSNRLPMHTGLVTLVFVEVLSGELVVSDHEITRLERQLLSWDICGLRLPLPACNFSRRLGNWEHTSRYTVFTSNESSTDCHNNPAFFEKIQKPGVKRFCTMAASRDKAIHRRSSGREGTTNMGGMVPLLRPSIAWAHPGPIELVRGMILLRNSISGWNLMVFHKRAWKLGARTLKHCCVCSRMVETKVIVGLVD